MTSGKDDPYNFTNTMKAIRKQRKQPNQRIDDESRIAKIFAEEIRREIDREIVRQIKLEVVKKIERLLND